MLWKNGEPCKKIKFHALLKDWSAREKKKAKLRGEDYPDYSIFTIEWKFGDKEYENVDKWVNKKITEIAEQEMLPDNELLLCSDEERWAEAPKFAVYAKQGDKKARKLCDTQTEAEEYATNNGFGFIEERKGNDRKVADYWLCGEFWPYWQEKYKAVENGE